jgi:long-chain acyl-CoA synthetase
MIAQFPINVKLALSRHGVPARGQAWRQKATCLLPHSGDTAGRRGGVAEQGYEAGPGPWVCGPAVLPARRGEEPVGASSGGVVAAKVQCGADRAVEESDHIVIRGGEMQTLTEMINRNAQRYPDKIAFIFEDRTRTYGEVNRRINRLVKALADLGVGKGDRVGILAHNCPQYFEVVGLAKAGRVCVPLNYRSVGRELTYLIDNSEISTLILQREFVDVVESIRHQLGGVSTYICLDAEVEGMPNYEELISRFPPEEPTDEVEADDPCVLFYTSGTTGRPKAAIHTHRSLLADATLPHRRLGPDDRVLCVMPFFHVGGLAAHMLAAFAAGATMLIHRRFDERLVLEAIDKERLTYVFLVPAMIIRLLEHPDLSRYDLSSLHTVGYTGAPMPVEALRRGVKLLGEVFVQEFGQTETLNMSVLKREDHKVEGSPQELNRLESAGKPLKEGELRIVDELGRDVPVGEPGEIIAHSNRLMKGYWRMPEETAETMKDGWLHTGDVGKMDEDGYIYVVDRKKDMIISGGENIYPREVEEVLYMHPAVLEAAVVGVPDEKWGESVKALVLLRPGSDVREEDIIEFCKQHMASYKKPRSVEFWDDFPRTGSGKIRKSEIRESYWQGYEKRVH